MPCGGFTGEMLGNFYVVGECGAWARFFSEYKWKYEILEILTTLDVK